MSPRIESLLQPKAAVLFGLPYQPAPDHSRRVGPRPCRLDPPVAPAGPIGAPLLNTIQLPTP